MNSRYILKNFATQSATPDFPQQKWHFSIVTCKKLQSRLPRTTSRKHFTSEWARVAYHEVQKWKERRYGQRCNNRDNSIRNFGSELSGSLLVLPIILAHMLKTKCYQSIANLTSFSKVGVPKLNTTTIWTPIFEWYVLRWGPKNGHMFERDWTSCSKNATHSRFYRHMIGETHWARESSLW